MVRSVGILFVVVLFPLAVVLFVDIPIPPEFWIGSTVFQAWPDEFRYITSSTENGFPFQFDGRVGRMDSNGNLAAVFQPFEPAAAGETGYAQFIDPDRSVVISDWRGEMVTVIPPSSRVYIIGSVFVTIPEQNNGFQIWNESGMMLAEEYARSPVMVTGYVVLKESGSAVFSASYLDGRIDFVRVDNAAVTGIWTTRIEGGIVYAVLPLDERTLGIVVQEDFPIFSVLTVTEDDLLVEAWSFSEEGGPHALNQSMVNISEGRVLWQSGDLGYVVDIAKQNGSLLSRGLEGTAGGISPVSDRLLLLSSEYPGSVLVSLVGDTGDIETTFRFIGRGSIKMVENGIYVFTDSGVYSMRFGSG